MTIIIPAWLLWVLGIPLGLLILLLAFLGAWFLYMMIREF